jgi:hypothetical protein
MNAKNKTSPSIKTLKDCFKLKAGSLIFTDPRSKNLFTTQKVSKEENYRTFTKDSYKSCQDIKLLINKDSQKIQKHSYSRKQTTTGNSFIGAFTGRMILTVHLSFLDLLIEVLTIEGNFIWVVLERIWEDEIYNKMEDKQRILTIKFKSLSERTKRKNKTTNHFLTTQCADSANKLHLI